jgi:hypothetical protein
MRAVYLAALVVLNLSLTGCPSGPVPKVDVKLWAGSPDEVGIRRNAQEFESCSDPKFNGKVCLTYDDLAKFYSVILKCEKWPAGVAFMTEREKKRWMKVIAEERLF